MNAYDFDNTVFVPDSSVCFFLFCLRRYPRAVSKALFPSAWQAAKYLAHGKKDAKELKESLFSFLNRIDDVERAAEEFWDIHISGIQSWYLERKKSSDLIISASPEFLLRIPAEYLGVSLIATPMNPYTGKIAGKNCHDEEKKRRFLEQYSEDELEEFYSDSLSDTPMARIASKAFLVKDGEPNSWPDYRSS